MDILEEADMGFYGFHESEKGNVILVKSYRFALRIVQIYHLLKEKREYDICRQLLRAGTSVGANVNEATAGQSRKDFAAKMAVASKEAREQGIGCVSSLIRSWSKLISVMISKRLTRSLRF